MTHYPAALEEDVRSSKVGSLRASAEDQWARLRKERARWWVRRLGMLAACGQLGTAFAATRALRTTEARQRLVDMDLRSAPAAPMHEALMGADLFCASHAMPQASRGLPGEACAGLHTGAG